MSVQYKTKQSAPLTLLQMYKNGNITQFFYWNVKDVKKDIELFRTTKIGLIEKLVVKGRDLIIDEIVLGKSKPKYETTDIQLMRVSMADISKETKEALIKEADYFRCADSVEAYLISKDAVKVVYNRTQIATIINETALLLDSEYFKQNGYLMLYNPNDIG